MKTTYSLIFSLFAFSLFGQFDPITNGDFETWEDDTLYDYPTDWGTSDVDYFYGAQSVFYSSDAQDGLQSAEIRVAEINSTPIGGYVYQGSMGPSGPDGGIPYSDNFEAITFQYKCDLPSTDTLYMVMVRFFAGTPVDFAIIPAVYGTVGTWTPNLLFVGNITHDELFIGFMMGHPLGGSSLTPGAWARIDNVELLAGSVTTTPIPNPSFESWSQETTENPASWNSLNDILSSYSLENVTKTTDANSGTYAAEMTTIYSNPDTIAAVLNMGPINLWAPSPFGNAPYNGTPARFRGAYKYAPVNNDQAWINIVFYQGGIPIGTHTELFSAQTNYTTFDEQLTITGTPDSINFIVWSGDNPGSVLKIDDLEFVTIDASLDEEEFLDFSIYPNPANHSTTIVLPADKKYDLLVHSVDGKCMEERKGIQGNQLIYLDQFDPGIYTVIISNGDITKTEKLLVE